MFSSPYHHQTNSLAKKSVGICKALWTKANETKQCPYTAVWMHRITSWATMQLPSPYELLYRRKPRMLLPNSNVALQSKPDPDSDIHHEYN